MNTQDKDGIPPQLVEKSGPFNRVADPLWANPLATEPGRRRGGRWNASETFQILYLNENVQTARANVAKQFDGAPYEPTDMIEGPILVTVEVSLQDYVDASSDTGLDALGLPASYPRAAAGSVDVVSHAVCQPIGARLFGQGQLGIACRSAAAIDGSGAELAWFHQPDRVVPDLVSTRAFEQWW